MTRLGKNQETSNGCLRRQGLVSQAASSLMNKVTGMRTFRLRAANYLWVLVRAAQTTMATRNTSIVFTAFLATSVDGYIARTDGSVDFLDAANATMTPGEDCGISAYLASIDAIVMGRKTYLHVLSMENWMYGDVPLFVVSGEMKDLPVGSPPSVRLLRTREVDDILTALNKYVRNVFSSLITADTVRKYLSSTKTTKVYVDGGELVRSFINAGLLSEITITVIPKLIGNGRSLFGGTRNVEMILKECKHWDFGFVQSTYGMRYSP